MDVERIGHPHAELSQTMHPLDGNVQQHLWPKWSAKFALHSCLATICHNVSDHLVNQMISLRGVYIHHPCKLPTLAEVAANCQRLIIDSQSLKWRPPSSLTQLKFLVPIERHML